MTVGELRPRGLSGVTPLPGWARDLAEEYARDPLWADLVETIIYVESGGDPNARGVAGEQGLMQLMPATARDLHVDDPFDPEQNVRGGTDYLRWLYSRYQHPEIDPWPWVLAAYNWGPVNVDQVLGEWGRVPSTVREYAENILTIAGRRDFVDDFLDAASGYQATWGPWLLGGLAAVVAGGVAWVITRPKQGKRRRK